jgi:hypothetical protein
MIRVIHCKSTEAVGADVVYIGRPGKWGNPFAIGRDGSREEVIHKYELYIKGRADLMAALGELEGKRLSCWCSPKACHGDVLAKLVGERRND